VTMRLNNGLIEALGVRMFEAFYHQWCSQNGYFLSLLISCPPN